MNEPTCRGHRGNVLDARYVEVGVGYHLYDRPTDEYERGQHHHVTQNFRADFSLPRSAWCADVQNDCEVPPAPPTTGVCPPQLIAWDFCPQPSTASLERWGCPAD